MAEQRKTLELGIWWAAAGGFLLLVLVGVIVGLVIWPGNNTASQSDELTSSPSPTQVESPEDTESSSDEGSSIAGAEEPVAEPCSVDDADTSFPASAPEFSWEESTSGVVLPVSDEHGPFIQDDYFWRCSSQTISGAVFAGPALMVAFPAGHYDAAEDSPRAREYFGFHDTDNPEFDTIHVGFRVLESTDTTATVEYLIESQVVEGSVSTTLNLVWDDRAQDWRLDLSQGEPSQVLVEDTSDFTLWR